MITFFKKVFLFSIPFICWFFIILIVDPYDYFGISIFENDMIKKEIAIEADHGRRYEFIRYRKNPQKNIIIGDSQLQHLDETTIPGGRWAQLSTPGSGIEDEVYILEELTKHYKLDTVLLGVNPFEFVYQESATPLPVTKSAYKLTRKPYLYFFDRCVYSATFDYIYSITFNKGLITKDTPDMSKDVFWNKQLDFARRHLNNKTPQKIRVDQLKRIRQLADEYDFKVISVIPISHTDLYRIYSGYINEELLPLLSVYTDVIYDFHFPNNFTRDKNNFGDPFHAVNDNDIYVNSLFRGDTTYCKVISCLEPERPSCRQTPRRCDNPD